MAEHLAAAAAIALTAALTHQVVSAWRYARSAADPQTAPACRRGIHNGRPVQLQEDGRPLMYLD